MDSCVGKWILSGSFVGKLGWQVGNWVGKFMSVCMNKKTEQILQG